MRTSKVQRREPGCDDLDPIRAFLEFQRLKQPSKSSTRPA
jgi:hypothetical protein